MNRREFYSDKQWNKFIEFSKNLETPCLIVDLSIIKNFQELISYFPYAKTYYAINPTLK